MIKIVGCSQCNGRTAFAVSWTTSAVQQCTDIQLSRQRGNQRCAYDITLHLLAPRLNSIAATPITTAALTNTKTALAVLRAKILVVGGDGDHLITSCSVVTANAAAASRGQYHSDTSSSVSEFLHFVLTVNAATVAQRHERKSSCRGSVQHAIAVRSRGGAKELGCQLYCCGLLLCCCWSVAWYLLAPMIAMHGKSMGCNSHMIRFFARNKSKSKRARLFASHDDSTNDKLNLSMIAPPTHAPPVRLKLDSPKQRRPRTCVHGALSHLYPSKLGCSASRAPPSSSRRRDTPTTPTTTSASSGTL